jgi:hypothetical protein
VRLSVLYLPLVLLSISCGAGWHEPTALAPGPLPSRQQVQVWSDGRAWQWHAVAVSPDSISGVPFTESPTCLVCREGIVRTAVDSVRLGNPVAGFWRTIGLVLGAAGALLVVACEGWCHPGN